MSDTTAIAQEQIDYLKEQNKTADEAMVMLGYPLWPRPNWDDVAAVIRNKHTFITLGQATATALNNIAGGMNAE